MDISLSTQQGLCIRVLCKEHLGLKERDPSQTAAGMAAYVPFSFDHLWPHKIIFEGSTHPVLIYIHAVLPSVLVPHRLRIRVKYMTA